MFEKLSQKVLTTSGWALLGCGVFLLICAQVMGRRDLLYLALLCFVLVGASAAVVWLVRPKLKTSRTFSRSLVQAGETATVRLEIVPSRRTTTTLDMHETLPSRFGQAPEFRFPSRMPGPDGSSLYEYRIRCSQRGLFTIGPLIATFPDALGLAHHQHKVGSTSLLTVTPPVHDLGDFSLKAGGGLDGVLQSMRLATPSNDDVMTREYRHGDSMRRVHWPATARHGELMVRQEDSVTTPEAMVVLDRRADAQFSRFDSALRDDDLGNGLVTSSRFEWAVTMTASIGNWLLQNSFVVRMIDQEGKDASRWNSSRGSDSVAFNSYSGTEALESLLTPLASVELLEISPNGKDSSARRNAGKDSDQATSPFSFGTEFLDTLAGYQSRGPLIALLGTISERDAERLATAANYFPQCLAILCVDGKVDPGSAAVKKLQAAGWNVAEVNEGVAQSRAWDLLGEVVEIGSAVRK